MRLVTSPADTAARGGRPSGRRDALLLGLVLCVPVPLLAVTGLNIPLPGGVVEAFVSIVPGGGDAAVRASAPASTFEGASVLGASRGAPETVSRPTRGTPARERRAAAPAPAARPGAPGRTTKNATTDLPARPQATPRATRPAVRPAAPPPAQPVTQPATQPADEPARQAQPADRVAAPPADSRPAPVAEPERKPTSPPVDATPPPPPPVVVTPVEPVPLPPVTVKPGVVIEQVEETFLPDAQRPAARLPGGADLPGLPVDPTGAVQPVAGKVTSSGSTAG